MNEKTIVANVYPSLNFSKIRGYITLTKPRLLSSVLLSTVLGYILPVDSSADVLPLLYLLLGTAMIGAGANTLNQWQEQIPDSKMRRTKNRPLPTGKLSGNEALAFGIIILNRFVDWSQKLEMGFNEAKCNVLHLGSTNPCYEYSMKNSSLEAITEEKDLGITIDRDLKFHMHVSKVVNKASKMLGRVRATFTCIDETTLPMPFTIMIRPHLKYGNVICCPRFQPDKLEVEKT